MPHATVLTSEGLTGGQRAHARERPVCQTQLAPSRVSSRHVDTHVLSHMEWLVGYEGAQTALDVTVLPVLERSGWGPAEGHQRPSPLPSPHKPLPEQFC